MAQVPLVITVSLNPAIDRIMEVPRFAIGQHQRGRLVSRTPAGKAVNVSRALATLGVRNIATGFLGEQEVEFFEKAFDPARVQAQFLPLPAPTRENITIVDPVAHIETHIRDVGFVIRDTHRIRLGKKLSLMCREGSIVVFSGSVPEGISPEQFVDLLEICISAGARVAVDTSGEPLRAAASLPLWLMKPNVAELSEIAGRPLTTEADLLAAGRDLARRVKTVIVSRGEAGGFCFIADSVLAGRVPLEPERVRNTVGCGDSLLAGFIAGQILHDNVRESYRYALAVATASAVGLEPCRFAMKDVEEFIPKAVVEGIP
ncbi:MAG: 1-phosphofructokinase family hexose kinase [Phycisphaerae bacterium]